MTIRGRSAFEMQPSKTIDAYGFPKTRKWRVEWPSHDVVRIIDARNAGEAWQKFVEWYVSDNLMIEEATADDIEIWGDDDE